MSQSISRSYYLLLLIHPLISSIQRHLTALFISPAPLSYPRVVRRPPGIRPHPSPVSLCRLSLRPSPSACFYCRVPRPLSPPCRTRPAPRYLLVPWWLFVIGPSVSFVSPTIPLPMWFSASCNILVFGVCLGGIVCVRRQGARAPPLPGSRSPQVLSLYCYLDMKAPFSPPPPSPISLPPCCLDPVPTAKVCGA